MTSVLCGDPEKILEKEQLNQLKEEKGCEVCVKRDDEYCKPGPRGFCTDWSYDDDE